MADDQDRIFVHCYKCDAGPMCSTMLREHFAASHMNYHVIECAGCKKKFFTMLHASHHFVYKKCRDPKVDTSKMYKMLFDVDNFNYLQLMEKVVGRSILYTNAKNKPFLPVPSEENQKLIDEYLKARKQYDKTHADDLNRPPFMSFNKFKLENLSTTRSVPKLKIVPPTSDQPTKKTPKKSVTWKSDVVAAKKQRLEENRQTSVPTKSKSSHDIRTSPKVDEASLDCTESVSPSEVNMNVPFTGHPLSTPNSRKRPVTTESSDDVSSVTNAKPPLIPSSFTNTKWTCQDGVGLSKTEPPKIAPFKIKPIVKVPN